MTRRKDGRWQTAVVIDGKRMYFYSTADTEKKAIKDIEKQMIAYIDRKTNGATFNKVADSWYARALETLSETTTVRYKSLKNRCVEHFGEYLVKDITPAHIDKFLLTLAAQGFALKSIKAHLSVIRLIFKHAIVEFGAVNDPSAYATLPHAKKPVRRTAANEEQEEIVKNSCDAPFGLFAYTLLYTGLRRGEAIALKWSDIDFEKKTITIKLNSVYPSNRPLLKDTKSDAGERKIILLDCLAEKLRPLMPRDRSQYVFSGAKLRGNSWYTRRWEEYQKATGLTITPHQLRHTYATILFEADVDIKDAQSLMGHADIATTRNIYTHIRASKFASTADKLNKFVSKGV